MGTLFIGALVFGIIIWAARRVYKDVKGEKNSGCCSGCSGCGCNNSSMDYQNFDKLKQRF